MANKIVRRKDNKIKNPISGWSFKKLKKGISANFGNMKVKIKIANSEVQIAISYMPFFLLTDAFPLETKTSLKIKFIRTTNHPIKTAILRMNSNLEASFGSPSVRILKMPSAIFSAKSR